MADYASVLTGGSNNFATTSEHLNALATDILEDGVVGSVGNTAGVAPMTGGLACNAQGTPDMTVAVTAGYAYVTATPSGQSSQRLRANIAAQNATIAANSTGGTRYDWIYVTISAANAANPAAAGDNVASITVSRSTSASTDNGTPPTYGYAIAVVTVANGASSITNGNITDLRESVAVVNNSSSNGWTSLGDTPDTVTANGNRSYDLVFNSVDHTDTITPGTRLKLTRSTTAPTQCADLELSSSQYFNDTSVSGMTFTDDFTCSAWVKLESYGTAMVIASRYNGTNGWYFLINSTGCVQMDGFNGGGANYSHVTSQLSIPLGKWVHVAAQLDMSSFTATTTTSYTMIDGLDTPAVVARGGTNPTALVQAGNLEIGATNGGTQYLFDGKLAQVAIYSAKVAQATIRSSMSQGLTGSETSLVSAYSFNNSITDLNTSNANNLTAQNSAAATATDSPFASRSNLATGITAGTTEYAVVTSSSYSTNTTITVQVPEGGAIPTSGGVGAVSYSYSKAPFGFISQRSKWLLFGICRQDATGATNSTWVNVGGLRLSLPTGEWLVSTKATIYLSVTTAGTQIRTTLSTGSTSETDIRFTTDSELGGNTTQANTYQNTCPPIDVSTTAMTIHYLNSYATANATIYNLGNRAATMIIADNAYI